MRVATRIPRTRVLDSQTPIWQRLGMETTASGFKFRANALKGRKRFPINSYQPAP